jgi:hypothetical protein
MRIRSGRSHTPVKSRARKPDDLLSIWLDLLKTFDDAPRRRAAKLRRTQLRAAQRPDAAPPVIGCPSLSAVTARSSDHLDLINVGVEAVLFRAQFGKQALNFQA